VEYVISISFVPYSLLTLPLKVVDLDHTYKSRIQAYQQRAYFYGTPLYLPPGVTASSAALGGEALTDLTLSPYSSVVGFNDISIYRIGGGQSLFRRQRSLDELLKNCVIESMAPSSALPIGAARVITALQPMKVDPSQAGSGILNALLALLSPLPPGTNISDVGEGLIDVDVAGYLLVYVL
jgi:polyribonucleotide 5'-hydroxyl-kinase